VFPSLSNLATEVTGEGISVVVRFSKSEGMPVRLVGEDEAGNAGAVRELDLQRKFHWSKPELASKLGLTQPRCLALRRYLGLETDDACRHEFRFGSSVHTQYSDNAYRRMRQALDDHVDLDAVWRRCRPGTAAELMPQAS